MKSKHVGRNREGSSEFAALLEKNLETQDSLSPGHYCQAVIKSARDTNFVFLDTPNGPGVIHREELLDVDGNLTVNPGSRIGVFFRSLENGEKVFTRLPTGKAKRAVLTAAYEQKVPLPGRIARKTKGGFEIQLGDAIAFCPFSHMESGEIDEKTTLLFLVTELREKQAIVSRRAFLNLETERLREELQGNLQIGDIVTGTVKSVQDFGVFVDIGGMEGLVPRSEIAYQRVKPSEAVKVDETVRVKVLDVDWKEDKMTLSIRALLANPWQGDMPFKQGDILEGQVESVKNFGVFIKLPGNFTGLVPASESGVPRGQPLDKNFEKNQAMRVMVVAIDREREKISLSVGKVKDADIQAEYREYMENQNSGPEEGISSFGRLLQQSLNKNDKKK